jgi:ABC-type uncharacterized transport system substrate-binding protein
MYFATSGATVGALQQATETVPIVFVTVIDPVGGGWVASLARPGGNVTGFAASEFSLSAQWLELLNEIAPARRGSPSSGIPPCPLAPAVLPRSKRWPRRLA